MEELEAVVFCGDTCTATPVVHGVDESETSQLQHSQLRPSTVSGSLTTLNYEKGTMYTKGRTQQQKFFGTETDTQTAYGYRKPPIAHVTAVMVGPSSS